MRRKKNAPDEYEVGYGKPPQHTRFKPGQSGNPKGRPKESKALRSLLHRALFKKMTVKEDGQVRTMSRIEAVITRLVGKALNGDVAAANSVIRLTQQNFPGGEEPEIMKIYLQHFGDKEFLAERTLQVGGGGQSTDWVETERQPYRVKPVRSS